MNSEYFNPQGIFPTQDKGTQMMESLLLQQYHNSPNLKEYMGAFIAELDILFKELDNVYLGRFLEYATGAQQDVIGIILGQSRAVSLPKTWFGFKDGDTGLNPAEADQMADESSPAEGGRFRDENNSGFAVTPLDDFTYRKVLLVKALCNNSPTMDVNTQYFIIQTLIGKVPALLELVSADTSGVTLGANTIQLNCDRSEVSLEDIALVDYMSRYFIPTGFTFIINRT
tara:strand:- start:5120 stop:5803 length:684 start_codon:yes stop_codon:yes gene_type:complete